MDLSLNDEQKQIKALVRDFCKREVDQKRIHEILRQNDAAKTLDKESFIKTIQDNWPHDLVKKAHEAELHHIGIPTKYGGPGPDTSPNMAIAVALEEVGYSGGLVQQDDLIIGPGFGDQAMRVSPYFTEEEREARYAKLLQPYTGQIAAGTISEPAGSVDEHMPYDEGGNETLFVTARRDGDGWVINGDKMYSNKGAVATTVGCMARTKDGPISESMSNFVFPTNTPGVSRTINPMIFVSFGGNAQFHYDNVRVPDSALDGALHMHWKKLAFSFSHKWQVRSWAVGTLIRQYEHMMDYARQRICGGRPIIQFTDCAAKLGELAMRLESLRAFHYKVAWECDQEEEYMAKTGATAPPYGNWYYYCLFLSYLKEVSWKFAEAAHDVYGSLAASEEMPVESFLRYNFFWRAAALPPNMSYVRATRDYDIRNYHESMAEPVSVR